MHRVLQQQEDDRVPAPGHRASVCMHCLRGEVVPETQHLPHVQRESGCSGASVLMTGGTLRGAVYLGWNKRNRCRSPTPDLACLHQACLYPKNQRLARFRVLPIPSQHRMHPAWRDCPVEPSRDCSY